MVDCYMDWDSVNLMRNNTTSDAVIRAFRDYFARTTVPMGVGNRGQVFTLKLFVCLLLFYVHSNHSILFE